MFLVPPVHRHKSTPPPRRFQFCPEPDTLVLPTFAGVTLYHEPALSSSPPQSQSPPLQTHLQHYHYPHTHSPSPRSPCYCHCCHCHCCHCHCCYCYYCY